MPSRTAPMMGESNQVIWQCRQTSRCVQRMKRNIGRKLQERIWRLVGWIRDVLPCHDDERRGEDEYGRGLVLAQRCGIYIDGRCYKRYSNAAVAPLYRAMGRPPAAGVEEAWLCI